MRAERLARQQNLIGLPPLIDLDHHGREILHIDLKRPQDTELSMQLIAKADILPESIRPGRMG